MYKIAVIPGDGIGKEVVEEAVKVLNSVGEVFNIEFKFDYFPYGAEYYLKTGKTLEEDDLKELSKYNAILFGAVGDPRVKPGILEQGILLKLRFYFDLYVNLRPVKALPNVNIPISGKNYKDINFYVVRENTEDFYVGIGDRTRENKKIKLEVLRELYKLKFDVDFEKNGSEEIAYQIGVISKEGARRVIEYAFKLAEYKGLRKVTSVDKANVLTYVYSLWRDVFEEVARKYSNIEYEHVFVDAMAMFMVTKPEAFDVVVTPNMFGDILTDLGAAIQGGIGLAPSGNIGDKIAMFEPVHGSAPDIKGKGIANPIATILSSALMLDYLGEKEAAETVEKAVEDVLANGIATPDMGGKNKTQEVGDAIAKRVKEISG